jgi:hypothetical protein
LQIINDCDGKLILIDKLRPYFCYNSHNQFFYQKMKNILTFLSLLLTISAISQDRIIKKNSEIINCKVSEVGADEVKYYYAENPKLVFGIDKALVERIEFATGEVVKVEANSFKNTEYYANQNKHALKINFLSPLFGSTEFAYEQVIRPGRSWETSLGIIGLGNDVYDMSPRGLFGKFTYKFTRNPDFYMNRMHYSHILKGGYFAPEIALRYMSYENDYYSPYSGRTMNEEDRESQGTLALMLKLGKQWVFDDAFLLDIYFGVGYGFGTDDSETIPYGFIVGSDEVPIAFTSGIKIGWVFGKE